MFFSRKRQPVAQAAPVAYARPAPMPDPRIKQVEAMERRYFLADAIRTDIGNRDGRTYQSGISVGIAEAIALLIDKNSISVMSRLEQGRSPLTWGTLCWVPQGYTNAFDHIEDRTERIDARHRDALKADGHPLYTIKYHPERLSA